MSIRTDDAPVTSSTALAGQGASHLAPGRVLAGDAQWPLAHRLVVLVPPSLKDEMGLAARLYAAAHLRRVSVLYLGMVSSPDDEPSLRRRLALLAAYTRDNHAVQADYRLAVGHDWLAWLLMSLSPGDLIICHAEQRARRGLSLQALGPALARQLRQPVVVLEGFCQPEAGRLAGALRRAAFWAGALLVVAAFFWLQVTIQRAVPGPAQSVLLAASVVVELPLLAAWSHRLA